MPYKTKKVGSKYCVYKKDGGKKVGCTKGTQEAKKKYLAALHIAEDEEYEAEKYYAKFGGRVVGPYDTEKEAYYDTKGDAEWIKKGVELNVKMESFKFFFESKDADIEDLIKMIKNPDPSKVKEYGGTEYVDMLRKKLARLRADLEYLTPEEIEKFAYNLGYEDIESSDMPNYFDYEGKRYYIKDEGDNWEVWANAWNEGNKDMRSDDYSNKADYYRELEIYGEDENTDSWGEKTKLFNRFLEIYRDTVENRDNPQITDAQMGEAKDIVKKLGRKYQERVRPTLVFRVGPRYDEMVDLYRKKNTKNIELNKQAPTVQDLANQIAALTSGKVSKRSSPVMTTGLGDRQRDASRIVLYNNKQELEKAKGWLEKNGKPISFKNLGTDIQGYKIGKYLIVPNFTAKKGNVEHYLEITTFSKTSTGGRSLKIVS